MATYEDANRGGRNICTIRSLGRDAMENSPWVSTWQEGKNRPWRTKWTTRHVGSVALVIFAAESTGHSTGRR